MKRYRVRWAQVAQGDLQRILDFIAATSPLNAEKVADRLEKLASTLERFPNRGRVVPELARAGMTEWRELVSTPWRLIFRVDGKTVVVLALVDGRRNLDDLLFERIMEFES